MRMFAKVFGLGLVATAMACGQPEEQDDAIDPALAAEIESALAQFEANPRAFMDQLPQKLGRNEVSPFGLSSVLNKSYITAKNLQRPDTAADAPSYRDLAKNLVDSLALTNLADMHSIKTAKLAESPWSDDYWALYTGSVAKRYADSGINYSESWKSNTDQVRNSTSTNVDTFSPAEKYDLLVGDTTKTLTKYNLDTGKDYADTMGNVETWMGICHGWAPAAYMIDRPQKSVEVMAADGKTKIKFYPSDIKALASLLWANGSSSTKFIGGRCNVKDPAKDSIGRITDSGCRDTNAGTWHLAIVNQIGKSKRSMVLDATYDYEVWNQPLYGYSYSYFNPKTNKAYQTITSAKVAVADFPEDKFKSYRAAGTTHIVGIAMDVKWTVETQPTHYSPDSASRDVLNGARYMYTLELDKDGNIIGGEWLQNAHPDFLWTPPVDAKATAPNDYEATGTWTDTTKPMPATWQSAAKKSAVSGVPLSGVVSALVAASRK